MTKIIEAMKKIKDLQRKAADLVGKVTQYHVDMDCEPPTYGSEQAQREQVSLWLQMHGDIVKEIERLRFGIQKTNVVTNLTVTIGDNTITKTISQWLHRRKDLSKMDMSPWKALNDKGLQATALLKKSSGENLEVKIRRYYDPKLRDKKIEEYASEPLAIDAALEMANATTDISE